MELNITFTEEELKSLLIVGAKNKGVCIANMRRDEINITINQYDYDKGHVSITLDIISKSNFGKKTNV